MRQLLRPLLPPAGVAFLLTALLAGWIRITPLAMPQWVQVTLSLALLAVLGGLLALVVRVERDDPTGASPERPGGAPSTSHTPDSCRNPTPNGRGRRRG